MIAAARYTSRDRAGLPLIYFICITLSYHTVNLIQHETLYDPPNLVLFWPEHLLTKP